MNRPLSLPADPLLRDAEKFAIASGLPPLEARMLLTHVTGLSRTQLITRDTDSLSPAQRDVFCELLERRVSGEPMAYLLGQREFFGRMFRVTPAVLIPRPDTEVVVDTALARLAKVAQPRVLDLGTGSGILAVTLACERPDAEVLATDISADALAVARQNAQMLGAPRTRFLLSDWYNAVPANADLSLIVSNPPYIAAADPHLAQGDLRFEPVDALTDHGSGLTDLATIVSGAGPRLAPGGWLLMEHGYDQGDAVRALLAESGFGEIFTARDLGDNDRCTGGRWPGAAPGSALHGPVGAGS